MIVPRPLPGGRRSILDILGPGRLFGFSAGAPTFGVFDLRGSLGYVGRVNPNPAVDAHTKGAPGATSHNLCNIMPQNAKLALAESPNLIDGERIDAIVLPAVAAKPRVDMTRLEPTTLGVETLCDMFDYEPLGGVEDLGDKGSRVGSVGVPGRGRTVYVRMTAKF